MTNDFDFDGDELTVIETTEPGNGQVEINPDGTVTYTPDNGFSGDDCKPFDILVMLKYHLLCRDLILLCNIHGIFLFPAFKYTISDGNGGSDEATVVVSVVEPIQSNPDANQPTARPTNMPSTRPTSRVTTRPTMQPSKRPTMKPSIDAIITCDDLCFESLKPDECPSCDPSILPSCSDSTLEFDALCESDGECELSDG